MRDAAAEILATLRAESSERNAAGMARFGIRGAKAHGVPVVRLRQLAKPHGRDRALARALWREGSVEAKILASLLDEPDRLTRRDAERYLKGLENWAETDAFAMNLFDRAAWAHDAAVAWSAREPELEKRTAFALMAALASHDKAAPDAAFLRFLPVIEREAFDGRNFVKKAVNWALRQIGKRNPTLRRAAVASAKRIRKQGTPAARWIAADALRELAPKQSQAHEKRLRRPRPRRSS